MGPGATPLNVFGASPFVQRPDEVVKVSRRSDESQEEQAKGGIRTFQGGIHRAISFYMSFQNQVNCLLHMVEELRHNQGDH